MITTVLNGVQANPIEEAEMDGSLTIDEQRFLKSLRRPERIQRFLDEEVAYNKDLTCRSPRRVLRDRLGHCAEGAFLAAAALSLQGHPPLIVDLEAVRDDDHLIAVYRQHGCWGAIAKSNYAGLRYREPVYRTLRELVMSYVEHYFNLKGEKSLRSFSRPVNLRRFESIAWQTTEEDLWPICEYVCTVPHWSVLPPGAEKRRRFVDRRLFDAALVGTV